MRRHKHMHTNEMVACYFKIVASKIDISSVVYFFQQEWLINLLKNLFPIFYIGTFFFPRIYRNPFSGEAPFFGFSLNLVIVFSNFKVFIWTDRIRKHIIQCITSMYNIRNFQENSKIVVYPENGIGRSGIFFIGTC